MFCNRSSIIISTLFTEERRQDFILNQSIINTLLPVDLWPTQWFEFFIHRENNFNEQFSIYTTCWWWCIDKKKRNVHTIKFMKVSLIKSRFHSTDFSEIGQNLFIKIKVFQLLNCRLISSRTWPANTISAANSLNLR